MRDFLLFNPFSGKIKKVLGHVRDDEKEHVAELTKLLQELDKTQKEKFEKD